MTKYLVSAFAAALFFSSFGPAMASPSNAFSLKNASSQTLHFTLKCTSPDDAATKSEAITIGAGKNMDYWIDGCDEYEIVKSTTDDDSGKTTTFKYSLDPGKSYELAWDEDENAWNIHEL